MPDARVTDVAVIGEFRADMADFASAVHRALTDIQLEVRRAMEWLTVEQPAYWRAEVRRSGEALAHAKDELAHARTYKQVGDYIPACIDEKKAVEKAKRRLEYAEQKVEAVRHWAMAARRAVDEFQGPVQQLQSMIDSDIPHSMLLLERMSIALEQYTSGRTPAAATWEELSGTKQAASMAQPVDETDAASPKPTTEKQTETQSENSASPMPATSAATATATEASPS